MILHLRENKFKFAKSHSLWNWSCHAKVMVLHIPFDLCGFLSIFGVDIFFYQALKLKSRCFGHWWDNERLYWTSSKFYLVRGNYGVILAIKFYLFIFFLSTETDLNEALVEISPLIDVLAKKPFSLKVSGEIFS